MRFAWPYRYRAVVSNPQTEQPLAEGDFRFNVARTGVREGVSQRLTSNAIDLISNDRMQLSPRNANTMWMLHFLHHLKDGGTAGFVMATGELSNSETARLEVRKTLVEQGYVDAIVQLTTGECAQCV